MFACISIIYIYPSHCYIDYLNTENAFVTLQFQLYRPDKRMRYVLCSTGCLYVKSIQMSYSDNFYGTMKL